MNLISFRIRKYGSMAKRFNIGFNSYWGLTDHPYIKQAAIRAVENMAQDVPVLWKIFLGCEK
jgi:hypothetical protein